ncbi:hypothetical protein LR48_Vigan2383s000100 [Vigna angularis]|nr:hypothetical protein LR48_Vigan2383s000100 [Vigna angularis]
MVETGLATGAGAFGDTSGGDVGKKHQSVPHKKEEEETHWWWQKALEGKEPFSMEKKMTKAGEVVLGAGASAAETKHCCSRNKKRMKLAANSEKQRRCRFYYGRSKQRGGGSASRPEAARCDSNNGTVTWCDSDTGTAVRDKHTRDLTERGGA